MNDVIINKIQSVQHCIERVREIYNNCPDFIENYNAQDAAILNIIRACDLVIDIANHVIKVYKMGIPNSSSGSFELLAQKQVITNEFAGQLKKMVSFRNITVHEYQKINYEIVVSVISSKLNDLLKFTDVIVSYVNTHSI